MMSNEPGSDGSFRTDREEETSVSGDWPTASELPRLPVMIFEVECTGSIVNVNHYWLEALGYERADVTGRPLSDFITDDSAGHTLNLLLTSEDIPDSVRDLPVQFVCADGGVIETTVSVSETNRTDRLSSAICVAVDISLRRRAEAVQATMVGIAQAANSTENLQTFLDVVRHQLSRLLDTSGFYVALLSDNAGCYTVPYRFVSGELRITAKPVDLSGGLEELVRVKREPVLVDSERYHLLQEAGQVTRDEPPARSWIGAPLRTSRDVIGVVALGTDDEDNFYDERHLELLSYVSEHLALAVERMRREEKLRQSEEKYRKVFNKAVSVIALVDPDGTVVDCSPRIRDVAGYRPDELIGQPMSKILHPHYLRKAEVSLKEVLTHGTSEGCDFKMVHKDGRELDVTVNSSGLTDAGGDYVRTICVIEDITRRKQMEHDLRTSEETKRAIFEGCGDGIAICDLNDVFQSVNPAMERLFGYHAEELVGRRFPGIEEIDEGLFEQWLERCRRGEAIVNYETVRPHKSGDLIPVSLTVSPVMGADGRLMALSFFYRDLSLKRKTEVKLAEMQHLESLALLAGGIAHDFNNIMTAILGNINLAMLDVDTDNEAYDRLIDAEAALVRAQSLTHQLLTFSKGGAPIRATAAIQEIITDSAGFALTGSRTRCEFEFAEDLKPVEVDRGQFSQVIHNLIINADQAMPSGGVVRIKADNLDIEPGQIEKVKPGQYIRVSISDHGAGIPEEYLERVFEPFFTTKQSGNGLGLATSFSIIRRHDGHIDIESKVGYGTTFNIYLPASPREADHGGIASDRELPLVLSGRALVMDDEETIREVAGLVLERLGLETDLVSDGRAAVELYRRSLEKQEPYSLVVLDLTVPGGMGAEETVKQIRELHPDAVVIVASGYANDRRLIDHRQYGFDEYVVKPFRVQELRRVVKRVLDSVRSG